MNTKGTKFLAVLAVLAMAFAAIAVINIADDNDAIAAVDPITGPLDFKGEQKAITTFQDVTAGTTAATNVGLGNNIVVSYDDATKTYTLTGTLAKQTVAYTTDWSTGANDSTKVFYADYQNYAASGKAYGLVIAKTAEGNFTITNASGTPTDSTDSVLLYLEKSTLTKRTVVCNENTYYVDLSGLTLATTTNPTTAYVAVVNTNALSNITHEGRTVTVGTYKGTDGANGTWTLVVAAGEIATLTLDNYKGNEQFNVYGYDLYLNTVNLIGTNSIVINIEDDSGIAASATRITDMSIISAATASLTISNMADDGYAISVGGHDAESFSSLTLGNESAIATTFDLTGKNRALNVSGNITIKNATLKAYGGERCIASQQTTVANGMFKLINSSVTAELSQEVIFNSVGDDDRFAVKAGAISVDSNSTLTTMGLRIRDATPAADTFNNAGKITVDGAYIQNPGSGLKKLVAGLYHEGEEAIDAYTSIPTANSYLLLTNDAGVYGNVTVKGSGTEIVQENVGVNEVPATAEAKQAIVTEINESDAKAVQLVITGDIAVDLSAAAAIEVSEDKSFNIVNNGAGSVSANVKIDNKTVKLANITGSVEIAKGSIKVYGDPWTAGTITLTDGDVAKISGTIGAVTFNYEGTTGSAKIIVEKDTVLQINTSLTIGSDKISMEIEGTVTADAAGKDLINGASKVTIKNGAVVEKIDITGTGAISVASGSDINGIASITNWDKVTGKDAASGTWTVNAAKTVLTLNKYNGTYNFANFAATLTTIKLTGDSVVSYAFPETFANADPVSLFGNATITSITTDTTGSLEIDVDVSKIAGDKLFQTDAKKLTVISGAAVNINGVAVAISVTGTNGEWTADQKKAVNAVGIASTTFSTYNANIDMDILSSYTAAGVKGLAATAPVTIGTGSIDIETAGTAIDADDAVTISNVTAVSLTGKKVGIKTTNDALTIQSVPIVEISGGIATGEGAVTIRESNVTVAGESSIFSISETNTSDVSFTGKLTVGAVTLTQNSTLTMSDAVINGLITNGGNIRTTGNVIINGNSAAAGNDANSTFVNDGTIALYGKIANKGQFTNNGSFTVYADAIAYAANTITVSEDLPADATKARLGSIVIADSIIVNADGTATVKATLTFQFKAGDEFVGVDLNKFEGTLTPSQTDDGFTLVLGNGSANVTVVYDASKAGFVVGESYTISVSGAIKDAGGNLRYLEANKTGTGAATITAHTIDDIMTDSDAAFTATAGKITNAGTFTIYSPATATIGTEFEGNLVANIAEQLNINGKFTGDITSLGASAVSVSRATDGNIVAAGDVTMSGTLTGNITSEGKVSITGTMTGDIIAEDDVSVTKKLVGDITVNANDKKFTVNGEVDGILTYNSFYKATKDAKAGEETTYTATMTVKGQGNFVINLAAGADATASTEVIPGSFTFQSMAEVEDKMTELTLTAGKLAVPADFTVPVGYTVVIEAGTVIEVAKTATLNVEKSALKVSKDATSNFETGTAIAVTYGKVSFVMSFEIENGAYTIYSNVAYALSNCDEGSELTVGKSDVATASITVKAGVNIIVDSVTLDFDKYGLTMADGAKITLVGTGKVIFKATGDNKAGLPEDEEYVYYTVSGTFVFDEENVIELDSVRFTNDSQITGVAATESTPAKISATFLYDEGIAEIVSGNATGAITLTNDHYYLTKADEEAGDYTLVSGTFSVAEDAIFDAIGIIDEGAVFDDVEDEFTDLATLVFNEGIIKLNNNTNVLGAYIGDGTIVLAENITLTIAKSTVAEIDDEDFVYGPVFTGIVVDSTDAGNGYVLEAVMAGSGVGNTIVIKAEKNGSDYYATIAGVMLDGDVVATTTAKLKQFTILEDATVTADATDIMTGGDSTAIGKLMTKAINMHKTGYGDLVYDATYTVGDYTVYTQFDKIDFEEVSEITIANDYNVDDDLDLSGSDLTITVAEGKKITIADGKYLIIGTPMTSLGGGTIISGTIALGAGSYFVAYSDVDFNDAKIVSTADLTVKAKSSILTIEDVLYATIFANAGEVVLADADADIVPVIEGYKFTKWNNFNENAEAAVGQTDAYAGAKAVLITVTVKYAEGVSYYLDGVEFAIYDTPTKVDYNSVFTAKINNTAQYQGTPLINGQNSFQVTESATLTVTGVTPIPAPEPEPAGMTLTEILLIVLVVLIAIMVVIIALRLNRS